MEWAFRKGSDARKWIFSFSEIFNTVTGQDIGIESSSNAEEKIMQMNEHQVIVIDRSAIDRQNL